MLFISSTKNIEKSSKTFPDLPYKFNELDIPENLIKEFPKKLKNINLKGYSKYI